MSARNDLLEVHAMKEGEVININWFEGGGAQVELVCGNYFLFECPAYGGPLQYSGMFTEDQLATLVKTVHSWT